MSTEGVIIAAGQSKRMSPHLKLLLKIGSESVLRRSIFSMLPHVSRLVVVTGYMHEIIEHHIHDIDGIETVYNSDYLKGMYSSVIAGLTVIGGDHAFLLPADCPFVCSEVFSDLSAVKDDISVPTYKNQPGHPVRLSKNAIHKVLTEDHLSLREFIARHPYRTVEVDCKGILMDIDTPSEYRRALRNSEIKEGYRERNK